MVNGELICWGENAHYQKLTGNTTNVLSPMFLTNLTGDVSQFEMGFNFSCAVISGGVKCWGVNDKGQLGDGTTTTRMVPVDVLGLESGVKKVALGWRHACALLDDGGVKCWGDNNAGELGRGFADTPSGYRSTADYVTGMSTGVDDIATGACKSEHTCALINGGMQCWGYNDFGQLGDGTLTSRLVPTAVSGLGAALSGVSKMIPSRYMSCAIVNDVLKCWGDNALGQLGDNNLGVDSRVPVDVDISNLQLGEKVVDAGLGEDQGCLLTDRGAVYCWGANSYGQLGTGVTVSNPAGVQAKPVLSLASSGVKSLSVGRYHACVMMDINDEIKCWGANNFGQVGIGHTTHVNTPMAVTLPP